MVMVHQLFLSDVLGSSRRVFCHYLHHSARSFSYMDEIENEESLLPYSVRVGCKVSIVEMVNRTEGKCWTVILAFYMGGHAYD